MQRFENAREAARALRPDEPIYCFRPEVLKADVVIADCSSWVCAGTNLLPGNILPGMLGYEVDRIAPSSPAGITVIASSPYVVAGQTRYANVTHYTAASGAGVFATGSMQWTWGLDAFSPGASEHGDRTNAVIDVFTANERDELVDMTAYARL